MSGVDNIYAVPASCFYLIADYEPENDYYLKTKILKSKQFHVNKKKWVEDFMSERELSLKKFCI